MHRASDFQKIRCLLAWLDMVAPCVPLVFVNEMPPQKILAMSGGLCGGARIDVLVRAFGS